MISVLYINIQTTLLITSVSVGRQVKTSNVVFCANLRNLKISILFLIAMSRLRLRLKMGTLVNFLSLWLGIGWDMSNCLNY